MRACRLANPAIRRAAVALAVGTLFVGIATGCTAVRSDLATADSACSSALPIAKSAVHGSGHLAGVRLVPVSSLAAHSWLRSTAERAGAGAQSVCLVAFTGHFHSSTVDRPVGDAQAGSAVVVVSYPSGNLLGTVIIARAGLRFGHLFEGV
jgi:hypothetical protein